MSNPIVNYVIGDLDRKAKLLRVRITKKLGEYATWVGINVAQGNIDLVTFSIDMVTEYDRLGIVMLWDKRCAYFARIKSYFTEPNSHLVHLLTNLSQRIEQRPLVDKNEMIIVSHPVVHIHAYGALQLTVC